jgi:hypothetical protein
MRTALFVFCLFCATGVWGQSAAGGSSLSYEPRVSWAPSHTQHAAQQPKAPGQNLLETSGFAYARGERPLWEVAPITVAVPLGDAARALRQEHAAAQKATKVWSN